MNTATRTTISRKAMRVATVFTGAAGLAVAFAPTALAAPGHAPTQGHSARAIGKTQSSSELTATIRSAGCTTNTWLHLQYQSTIRDLCKAFGYRGTMVPDSSVYMSAQCGGNNYGYILFRHTSLPYGPGTTYRNVTPGHVSAVTISGWTGTDKCAWPR
jgi:hypothetical protein